MATLAVRKNGADRVIQSGETSKEIVLQPPKRNKGVIEYSLALFREIIAALFWIYLVVKVFIFDFDIYLLERFSPDYAWLLNYKFFILIGTVATILLVTRDRQILLWALYIFLYPAIFFLWKIPIFIFRQRSWTLAFAFFDAGISFFESFKFGFITAAFFLASVAIVFSSSNEILLWLSSTVLLVVLSVVYIHSFILVFKPSGLYQLVHNKFFSDMGERIWSSFAMDANMASLPVENLDQKQLEKWSTNLQILVLHNRIFLFGARKLRDYQNSGLIVIPSVQTILVLIATTVFSFAAVNFGLYKINHGFFAFSAPPTFFTFFYYSFSHLMFGSIQDIIPTMTISQTASMIESFFALFLVMIFVSLLLSFGSQRHTDELNEVIRNLEEQAAGMENHIRDEYKVNNIEDAMAALEKIKSGAAELAYAITQALK